MHKQASKDSDHQVLTFLEANDKVVHMAQLGLALERKLYIDKLREVEKYVISEIGSGDNDSLLNQVRDILYQETNEFKLRDRFSLKK